MNKQSDTLQRFLVNRLNIRGAIVKLQQSYQTIIAQQAYPTPVAKLLGQSLVSSALLAALIKFKGNLSIQLQSKTSIELLLSHCNEQRHIRGIAKWQEPYPEFSEIFSEGILAITISPEQGKSYQGMVKLNSTTLAEAIESYFAQSEQLPTLIVLLADQTQASGILLQQLPNQPNHNNAIDWSSLKNTISRLNTEKGLNIDNERLIKQIFEEDVIIYDPEPIIFQCTCSEERSANAVRTLSQNDINELLQTYNQLRVNCEFCQHTYTFKAAEVYKIRNSQS